MGCKLVLEIEEWIFWCVWEIRDMNEKGKRKKKSKRKKKNQRSRKRKKNPLKARGLTETSHAMNWMKLGVDLIEMRLVIQLNPIQLKTKTKVVFKNGLPIQWWISIYFFLLLFWEKAWIAIQAIWSNKHNKTHRYKEEGEKHLLIRN